MGTPVDTLPQALDNRVQILSGPRGRKEYVWKETVIYEGESFLPLNWHVLLFSERERERKVCIIQCGLGHATVTSKKANDFLQDALPVDGGTVPAEFSVLHARHYKRHFVTQKSYSLVFTLRSQRRSVGLQNFPKVPQLRGDKMFWNSMVLLCEN